MLTAAERIDVARRRQPLDVLKRKADRARRRGRLGTREDADYSLAKSWRYWLEKWTEARTKPQPRNFCHLCHQFGKDWDEETKLYRQQPRHVVGCTYGSVAPEPYPAHRHLQNSTEST